MRPSPTPPLKTPHRGELRSALAALRMAGYPHRPLRRGDMAKLSGRMWHGLQGAFDPSTEDSMAVFKALGAGLAAFEKALDQHPRWIDATLAEAATPPGGHPPNSVALFGDFTPMHFCAQGDLAREARALMERGVDPGRYTGRVTATGHAAYTGSARVLAEIRAFGFDLRLWLDPIHVGPESSVAGSTLLHRLARTELEPSAMEACAGVLAGSRQWYPDLDCATNQGLSPLDWAHENNPEAAEAFIRAAQRERACREAKSLKAATPKKSAANPARPKSL